MPTARNAAAIAALGVGLAGTAAVAAAFRADMRAARRRLSGRSRVVETACGPIEVAEDAEGAGVGVDEAGGDAGRRGEAEVCRRRCRSGCRGP